MRCYQPNYVRPTARLPNDDRDEDGFLLESQSGEYEGRGRRGRGRQANSVASSRSGSGSGSRQRRKSPLPSAVRRNGQSFSPSPPPPPPPSSPPPYDQNSSSTSSRGEMHMHQLTHGNRHGHHVYVQDQEDDRSVMTASTSTSMGATPALTRSTILSNQLVSSLQEDRRGSTSPSSVLFPSRNIHSSTMLRHLREQIAELKADWTGIASNAVDDVQDINAVIASTRQERIFLHDCVADETHKLDELKRDSCDLYAHLSTLEKIARDRKVPWVRPAFIRNTTGVELGSQDDRGVPGSPGGKSVVSDLGTPSRGEYHEVNTAADTPLIVDEKALAAVKNNPYAFKSPEETVERALTIEVKPVKALISHLVPPPFRSPQEEKAQRFSTSGNKDPFSIDIDRLNRRLHTDITLSDAAVSPKKSPRSGLDDISEGGQSRNVASWKVQESDESPLSVSARQRHLEVIETAKNQLSLSKQKRVNIAPIADMKANAVSQHQSDSTALLQALSAGPSQRFKDDLSFPAGDDSASASTSVADTSLKSIMKVKTVPSREELLNEFYKQKEKKHEQKDSNSMESQQNDVILQDGDAVSSPIQIRPGAVAGNLTVSKRSSGGRRAAPPPPPPPPLPKTSSLRDSTPARTKSPLTEVLTHQTVRDGATALKITPPAKKSPNASSDNAKTERMTWKRSLSKLMSDFDEEKNKTKHRNDILLNQSAWKAECRTERAREFDLNHDDPQSRSRFAERARAFDLNHDVLPEEVAVHHLAMPHESEGHHYLRGHEGRHKMASFFPEATSDHSSVGTEEHTKFVRKSREFDLHHDVQPEEVAVHHLSMPHENEGHNYLRGHEGRGNIPSNGNESNDTSDSNHMNKHKHSTFQPDDNDVETSWHPIGPGKHAEFVNRVRDFDMHHTLQPEDVSVHHLAMPHENEGHHYLRGHHEKGLVNQYGRSTISEPENREQPLRKDNDNDIDSERDFKSKVPFQTASHVPFSDGHNNDSEISDDSGGRVERKEHDYGGTKWGPIAISDNMTDHLYSDDDDITADVNKKPEKVSLCFEEGFAELKKSLTRHKSCNGNLSRLAMFDHIRKLLCRQGSCVRFICRCHPEVECDDEDIDKYSTCEMTTVWLECITSRLATFWPLSERQHVVDEMCRLNPNGYYHVKWLSKLLLSYHPSVEEHFRMQKHLKKKEKEAASNSANSQKIRPIGDLTRKGRRHSTLQLEKDWNNFHNKDKDKNDSGQKIDGVIPTDIFSPKKLQPDLTNVPITATTPTSVIRLRAHQMAERDRLQEKKKKYGKLDHSRLEALLPLLFPEAKEVLKNTAHVMKVNYITPPEVEKELELHYPHGDLIDTKIMKHAMKLFGRKYTTTGEVLHVFKYLEKAVDSVEVGLLNHQIESSQRSSVAAKKKYPYWRDLLLLVTHFYDST